jgi:gamma-glutamyltranspeptidase / glutathione hydrolase
MFDTDCYPYHSKRLVTIARKGMVATSQHLAAQAGLDMMKKGGNAVDAIIAAAACLTVVEPCSNGIGGDSFALVWFQDKLHGLNASGPSPGGITAKKLTDKGYREMPGYGWAPVTVPGAPAAWAILSKRFGKLALTETLQPAINYAFNGFAVSNNVANAWKAAFDAYRQCKGEEFASWFDTFAPGGKTPAAGEIFRSPDMARTLQSIAETDSKSFYEGDLADLADAYSRKYGGFIRKQDLLSFAPEWVDPIHVDYRGHDVWEMPPNGQGIISLMALNLLKGFDFDCKDTVETYHRQIEALKLAFADGRHYVTDRSKMKVQIEDLLSDAYADDRRKLIGPAALDPIPGVPRHEGTVYLASADGEGNMVSFIQSNYAGFGSGLVVPHTGIGLHNRGLSFSLDPGHANFLEPGKKPYHTIIPGFLSKSGKAIGPFGVMGGFMQPQGHVQVIMNIVDFGLNPQSALDAPRWQWTMGKNVLIEHDVSADIVQGLARKGHEMEYRMKSGLFGQGQIIWRNENGSLFGGTEPRADGAVVGW